MLARRAGAAVVLWAAVCVGAQAADWHEAYRDGLKALAQGQGARAAALLERAAQQRPEPGRNVITYGTNVVDRYYPYLRLAEAYLQAQDLAGARAALKRSESWGREPAEERRRLGAQVDELAARLAPPPVAAPSAPPVVPRETPAATPIAAVPTPAAVAPPPLATPAPPKPAERSPVERSPQAARPASPAAPVQRDEPGTGTLEVVSQPPGASVYLDDELVGTTDAEWGRLVRSGVRPGPRRVRLTLAGHDDLVEEIAFAAGARVEFRRRLAAAGPPAGPRPVLYAGLALAALAAAAWMVRRRGAAPASPTPVSTPVSPPTPVAGPGSEGETPYRSTPPGMAGPGVRRDAHGQQRFGEFRLLEPLGRGGMATVYKAERRGELCALKRPLTALLDEPEFLERFLREADIGRTLHHPNIVRILERGRVDEVPFFTMELVPGENLQARLQREAPLDARLATRIVVQIAEALDYAHLKGVVHRDLKPSNVMVLADGTAKVMDYGIARARRFEGLTVTGSFLGTPGYAAPEALEGKNTDARSDLYSLGVIFYEALTGRRPSDVELDSGEAAAAGEDTPTPVQTPALPRDLERIVLRLLSRKPALRYASAEDLVVELRDFLNRAA